MPTKRVLIIEDKLDLQERLRSSLINKCAMSGIVVNIHTTERLPTAFRLVRENKFDVISTDLQYPITMHGQVQMDAGFSFIHTVRETYKNDTPIVLLTAATGTDLTKPQQKWAVTDDQFVLVKKDYPDEWKNAMLKFLLMKTKQEV